MKELGYWVNGDGPLKEASLHHALIAFQKIESRPRTGVLTEDEMQALRAAKRPRPRESGYPHVEIDLCRQVLFVVESGDLPLSILPVSTGSGQCFTEGGRTRRAITPRGRFTVAAQNPRLAQEPAGLTLLPDLHQSWSGNSWQSVSTTSARQPWVHPHPDVRGAGIQ